MKLHLLSLFDKIKDSTKVLIRGYCGQSQADITCRQFRAKVFKYASFLKQSGVCAGDRVAIIAEKCPESIVSFFSIWMTDGIALPICETLKNRELEYILINSGAQIILCSDSLKDKLAAAARDLNLLLFSFSEIEAYKGEVLIYEVGATKFAQDDTAFLIYTSGSTGNPKGVVLSHQGVFLNAKCSAEFIGMKDSDATMSALPYWHSFALTAELFTMLHVGGTICLAKTKTTFLADLKLLKPTIVLSVPRLAELLKSGIESAVAKKSEKTQELFRKAKEFVHHYYLKEKKSVKDKCIYCLIRQFVFKKIKANFGGRIKYFIAGGAPLDISLQEFFLKLDMPMYLGYGLTESSPVISINAPHDFKIGSSGKIIPWLKEYFGGDYIFEDDQGNLGKDIKGELLVKGKCVMQRYWQLPEETSQALKGGWLHTGDMGYIDEDGFLSLVGRKKSLLCLSGGEKFYPEFVEERIKSSAYITQAMIVGEGCNRASVLINTNKDILGDINDAQKARLLSQEIKRVTSDLEVYQRPFRHLVVPDFTMEDGLLTNTLKVRRHKVLDKYSKEVSDFLDVNSETWVGSH